MKHNFHQSIQQGKLSAATDILLNRRIDEDIRDDLMLIKMNLSRIERAIIQGRVNCIKTELALMNEIGYRLLKIHKEIQN